LKKDALMKRSSGPRKTANLSASLNRQLNGYALTASAAGVAVLALAPPAEAKIIYTPAHAKVGGRPVPMDLNHDGIVDFYLNTFLASDTHGLSACQYWVREASGSIFCSASRGTNAIRTIDSKGRKYAAALRYGQKIQRGEQFATAGRVILGYSNPGNSTNWRGPWVNAGQGVKHRYLGLKFKIKGHVHFGWARITVKTTPFGFTATLTGYAYETIPGKGIVAGQTKGSEDVEQSTAPPVTQTPDPPLGALAMGAPGLSIWRRKESVVPGD
jgi:hypothetical protein